MRGLQNALEPPAEMTPPDPKPPKRSLLTASHHRPHEGLTLLIGTGVAILLGLALLFFML